MPMWMGVPGVGSRGYPCFYRGSGTQGDRGQSESVCVLRCLRRLAGTRLQRQRQRLRKRPRLRPRSAATLSARNSPTIDISIDIDDGILLPLKRFRSGGGLHGRHACAQWDESGRKGDPLKNLSYKVYCQQLQILVLNQHIKHYRNTFFQGSCS